MTSPCAQRSLRSRSVRAAVGLAALLPLAACGGTAGEPQPAGASSSAAEPIAVTLITKDNINPFFITMQDGAKAAGAKNGVEITLAAGAEDGDEDGQVKAIEAAVARGDKGILITPSGPGVNPAIESARSAGLYVIALDTPPSPAETVDITFATDNFKAGELVGRWAAAQQDGQPVRIALLDQFNDKVVSVDVARDQGFLTGMGIDTVDKAKNGDEAKTGSYTGGKGGEYEIVCQEPTGGAQDKGKTAMENCLSSTKDIDLVYSINEPAGVGAADALEDAGVKATIVSVDGGCSPGLEAVKDGVIGATSQQYPVKMAELGVEAIKKIADSDGAEKPAVTPGLDFFDTGVALVTDRSVDGLESISVTEGEQLCWGK